MRNLTILRTETIETCRDIEAYLAGKRKPVPPPPQPPKDPPPHPWRPH